MNTKRLNPLSNCLSQRMLRRLACSAGLALGVSAPLAQQSRPAITGISHMCVFASDPAASEDFYSRILGGLQGEQYHPDGTRVELMEFQPATKPCCSSFTADSPIN